jgi:tRNA (guanine37-N1)-methyltransferase
MRFTLLTLFPAVFESIRATSLFGKAIEAGLLEVDTIDIRDFAEGKHRIVDDAPFGGGAGMVLKVEPVARAVRQLRGSAPGVRLVLLTPQGTPFSQDHVRRLAGHTHLAFVCGRYEGVDERVRSLVDEELSIGDFVLAGGEPAAWVVMDAVSRLVPGVLGSPESVEEESFCPRGRLEYPQYTRPRVFEQQEVPAVLLSGDHAAIDTWRRRQALERTARRRPDLLERFPPDAQEREWLEEVVLPREGEGGDDQAD